MAWCCPGLGLLGAFSALWMGIVEDNDDMDMAAEQNVTPPSGVILSVTVVIYMALMLVVLSQRSGCRGRRAGKRAEHHV